MSDMSDQGDSALDLFDDEQAERTIRRVWHDGRWFFSVIDVIGFLTESAQPRRYWTDMKRRLAEDEGFSEVYAKCVQLKMTALDGKQRLTEAADAETLLQLIQSVPSPKAEPFKQWLARGARNACARWRIPRSPLTACAGNMSASATATRGSTSASRTW